MWNTTTITAPDTCAVRVGSATTPVDYTSQLQSVYWVVFSTNYVANYTVPLTGVEFMNVAGNYARVRSWFFRMGFNLIGDGTTGQNGSLYNRIELETYGCLKAVGWTCQNGLSFVNENVLYYGAASHNDTGYTADSVAMLRISSGPGGGEFNGNKWYGGPSFEASFPGGTTGFNFIELVADPTTTVSTGVGANEFHGMRIDAVQPVFLYFDAPSVARGSGLPNVAGIMMTSNVFKFDSIRPTYWPTFGGNLASSGTQIAITAAALNTFEIPAFDPTGLRYEPKPVIGFGRGNVTARLSGSTVMVQAPARGAIYNRGTSGWLKEMAATLTASTIKIPSGGQVMGVFVDVRRTPYQFLNQLYARAELWNSGQSGRFGVIALAADGVTQLTSPADLQFDNNMIPSATGWYMTADMSPVYSEIALAWSANVAFLFIGVAGGTFTLDFTKLEVFAPVESGVVPMLNSLSIVGMGPSLPLIDDDVPYALGVPYNPVAQTITAITPGTTTQITTSAAHGYAVGDPVYVTGITGTAPVTGLNGTTVNVATVVSSTAFTVAVNTTGGSYTSGGTTQTDFMPQGQVVHALQPVSGTANPYEWVRTTSNTWTALNF